jgi:hypothetical protein
VNSLLFINFFGAHNFQLFRVSKVPKMNPKPNPSRPFLKPTAEVMKPVDQVDYKPKKSAWKACSPVRSSPSTEEEDEVDFSSPPDLVRQPKAAPWAPKRSKTPAVPPFDVDTYIGPSPPATQESGEEEDGCCSCDDKPFVSASEIHRLGDVMRRKRGNCSFPPSSQVIEISSDSDTDVESEEEDEAAQIGETASTLVQLSQPQGAVANVPQGTERGKRSKNWHCVYNNYPPWKLDQIEAEIFPLLIYGVVGKEIAASGTPHLQATFVFAKLMTYKQVIDLVGKGWHVEMVIALQSSIEYCKKDGSFIETGERPSSQEEKGAAGAPHGVKGKGPHNAEGGERERKRWKQAREAAQEGRMEDVPDQIYVCQIGNLLKIRAHHMSQQPLDNVFGPNEWFFGDSGTGKSRRAREEAAARGEPVYLKMLNKWWDGVPTPTPPVALLEDLDPERAVHLAHYIKIWADHYPFQSESKGTACTLRPGKIVITSNYSIEECFPRAQDQAAIYRRFNVYQFTRRRSGDVVVEQIHNFGTVPTPRVIFNSPN